MAETLVVQRSMQEAETGQPSAADANALSFCALPRTVVLIAVAAVVLRLAVAWWLQGEPLRVWDERDYDSLAVNLLRHGEFCFEPGSKVSMRPPLYPALVASVYAVAGEQNHTVVRVLQAFLGGGLSLVVFWLARGMYGERTGLVAAAICAGYPSLVAASGLVLTETVFALFLCGACLAMHGYLKRGGVGLLIAVGAFIGLAALTRSVMWLFVPVLGLFILVGDLYSSLPRRLLHAGLALAAMLAVMAPWAIRNTLLQKTFTAVDVMGGRNFMMGNYEHTPFHRPWDAIGIEGERAWHNVLRQQFPLAGRTQGQIDKLALRYGLEYVKAHPVQTLQRDIAKFFHFWQLEREVVAGLARGYWGNVGRPVLLAAAAVILGAYVAVLLSGVVGALTQFTAPWPAHVFPLLIVAFVCGVHTLVFGHSRYHLPLMPLVAVYAAAAWTNPDSSWVSWRRPGFWIAGLICGALSVSWAYELFVESSRL